MNIEEKAEQFRTLFNAIKDQIHKRIVGLDDTIDRVLSGLFIGGHVLLEGFAGLGKTLLVKTLAEVVDLHFSRIQFTPDLMPADIIGTNIILETTPAKNLSNFKKAPSSPIFFWPMKSTGQLRKRNPAPGSNAGTKRNRWRKEIRCRRAFLRVGNSEPN